MGYSLDNSPNTVVVYSTSINTQVTATAGAHTLHVKSWGNQGASCVADVPLTVANVSAPSIPSNAIAASGIHVSPNWKAEYDTGTGSGSATGAMSLVNQPSLSGTARQFVTTTTNYGGERYSDLFGTDAAATNFLYDGWIYLAGPTTGIANIEMDLNQVMANGQTVIFGFQCDGWSGTWDYTANTGTPHEAGRHLAALQPDMQSAQLDPECMASRADQLLTRQCGQRDLQVRLARWQPSGPERHRSGGIRARLGTGPADQLSGGWKQQHVERVHNLPG